MVALLLDGTLARAVLVPATMALLGKWIGGRPHG
jgi:uncharacterized membrane protein YdfJ with MMPL/SSD domain